MAITQCSPVRLWWDDNTVHGYVIQTLRLEHFHHHITFNSYPPIHLRTPTFQGLIPGGQSFEIPESQITTVTSQGTGFSWTPSVRAGSTVILVAGDDRGRGNGGSASFIVGYGDNSCLNDNSPSSTPGSPAGGSYPTSTSGSGKGNSSRFVLSPSLGPQTRLIRSIPFYAVKRTSEPSLVCANVRLRTNNSDGPPLQAVS